MLLLAILFLPLLMAGIISFRMHAGKRNGLLNAAGHGLIFILTLFLVTAEGLKTHLSGLFYIDRLSVFFLLVISIVNLACACYSLSYLKSDEKMKEASAKKSSLYYIVFNIFAFTMFLVVSVDNLGLIWVAVEMTTLASAFLVGFNNSKASVEAAWKYIIICSVGITLALLGTIFFHYTASRDAQVSTLSWSSMLANAALMNKQVVKLGFLFILVGYGTKAGIAPMHTWLPDAHSQAPSPASAMLSGVLLTTAVYAILRFSAVASACIGFSLIGGLLVFFGLLSMAVSAVLILVQRDLKRLLAYSSVENIGVICFGLGIGSPLGSYAALLHILGHAISKSLMFFSAGSIVSAYGTQNMNKIKGMQEVMPFGSAMTILGLFALTGWPPFAIFRSEMMILMASIKQGKYLSLALFLFFLVVAFSGMLFNFSKILFGKKPDNTERFREDVASRTVMLALVLVCAWIGMHVPAFLDKCLRDAAFITAGAGRG